MNNFLVCIRSYTYNHAQYIEDALNGFVTQKTRFPYVILLVDDASTDGQRFLIDKYLSDNFDLDNRSVSYTEDTDYAHIIFSQHKANKNCYIAVLYLKYNHFSIKKGKLQYLERWRKGCKYEAMCEGDDSWIDPYKLQKQVDILENNQNVNIAVHNAIKRWPDGHEKLFNEGLESKIYKLKDCLYMKWFTPTASFMFRNNFTVLPIWKKNKANSDMAILYTNLLLGDMYYSSDISSVYNYGTTNSMSVKSRRSILYKKKIGMLKTIIQLSNFRYIIYILPLMLILTIKMLICIIYESIKN